MNIFKGCLHRLTDKEEAEHSYPNIPGILILDNWRPFSYLAAVLDYKDLVEKRLIENECGFTPNKIALQLEADTRYVIKFIKIPKFDEYNLGRVIYTVKDAIGDIAAWGGRDYVALFDELMEVI